MCCLQGHDQNLIYDLCLRKCIVLCIFNLYWICVKTFIEGRWRFKGCTAEEDLSSDWESKSLQWYSSNMIFFSLLKASPVYPKLQIYLGKNKSESWSSGDWVWLGKFSDRSCQTNWMQVHWHHPLKGAAEICRKESERSWASGINLMNETLLIKSYIMWIQVENVGSDICYLWMRKTKSCLWSLFHDNVYINFTLDNLIRSVFHSLCSTNLPFSRNGTCKE